jgi:hypothetical protein
MTVSTSVSPHRSGSTEGAEVIDHEVNVLIDAGAIAGGFGSGIA